MKLAPRITRPLTADERDLAAEWYWAALGHARRLTRDPDWVQDAATGGLIRTVQRWRPDGGASFDTYLSRAVRSCLLGLQHRHRDHEDVDLVDPPGPGAEARAVAAREGFDHLARHLRGLRPAEALVVAARVAGYDRAEIARLLKVSESEVDRRTRSIHAFFSHSNFSHLHLTRS